MRTTANTTASTSTIAGPVWIPFLPSSKLATSPPTTPTRAATSETTTTVRSRALTADGGSLFVQDPKLCLYYRNRLTFMDREAT